MATVARPASTRGPRWHLRQRDVVPYLFIAPFFVVFVLFFLGPALFAFFASFHDWRLLGSMKSVGLKNYRLLLRDATFHKAIGNTLFYIASALVLQWPLSLILAVILNRRRLPGKSLLTAFYFIPVLTSSVAVVIVFVVLLDKDYGLLNAPLRAIGLSAINWLGSRRLSKFAVVLLITWRYTGYNMVLFLSSLKAIPREIYEAAWVDGAGKLQTFFHITIPMLRPAIAYVLIMGIIGGWNLFDESWLLTKAGPADSSLSVGNYLYRMSIQYLRMGYGSAVGAVLFVVMFVISLVQMRFFGIFAKED